MLNQEELTLFRRELHTFPEVSGQEAETAKRIVKQIRATNPTQVIDNIGGHGIAAIYGTKGKTVMVRCELDALPIQEINEFDHKSTIDQVSHKCGHDGHMAILVGLADYLGNNLPEEGRVVLLFQPAEENGEGAKSILADPKFESIQPDFVVALHNIPGEPKDKVLCKTGSFTPAVQSIIIHLDGKTSHAAEPENGLNPALAIAEILQQSLALQKPEAATDFAVVTPIQIEMGEEAYGISAGHGIVRLTIRTWDNVTMKKLADNIELIVKNTAKKYSLSEKIEWTQYFASNQNSEEVTEAIRNAANENNLKYIEKEHPFKWGEDFGLFTEEYKGAMFGLGAGTTTPALHNPDYDFPDDITPNGINMFKSIITQLLQ